MQTKMPLDTIQISREVFYNCKRITNKAMTTIQKIYTATKYAQCDRRRYTNAVKHLPRLSLLILKPLSNLIEKSFIYSMDFSLRETFFIYRLTSVCLMTLRLIYGKILPLSQPSVPLFNKISYVRDLHNKKSQQQNLPK